MANTIWFQVDLTRFRKDFSVRRKKLDKNCSLWKISKYRVGQIEFSATRLCATLGNITFSNVFRHHGGRTESPHYSPQYDRVLCVMFGGFDGVCPHLTTTWLSRDASLSDSCKSDRCCCFFSVLTLLTSWKKFRTEKIDTFKSYSAPSLEIDSFPSQVCSMKE